VTSLFGPRLAQFKLTEKPMLAYYIAERAIADPPILRMRGEGRALIIEMWRALSDKRRMSRAGDCCTRLGNFIRWTKMERSGHFPVLDQLEGPPTKFEHYSELFDDRRCLQPMPRENYSFAAGSGGPNKHPPMNEPALACDLVLWLSLRHSHY
jgi:hypothetical protein